MHCWKRYSLPVKEFIVLEPAYKDALQKIPIKLKVEGFMLNLYVFFTKNLHWTGVLRGKIVDQLQPSLPNRSDDIVWGPSSCKDCKLLHLATSWYQP